MKNILTIKDENTGEAYTLETLRTAKEVYEIILATERELEEEIGKEDDE